MWGAGPLVRRAALGVLRLAAQLLAAQDDVADALLRSLNLLPRLHPNVAWELAEPIAQQAWQHLPSVVPTAKAQRLRESDRELTAAMGRRDVLDPCALMPCRCCR